MFIRSTLASLRWGMFLLVFVLTVCWIIAGRELAQRVGNTAASTPEGTTEKIIKKLKAENPQAAAELTKIRENNDIRAVAAVLHEAEARGGLAAVQDLVDREAKYCKTPGEIRLASLYGLLSQHCQEF